MSEGDRTALPTGKRLASVDCLRGLAVAGMILAIMVAAATDAREVTIPIPDELVKCLLGLTDEMT